MKKEMIPNIKSFNVGVIVGRFQVHELTQGHVNLLKIACESFNKVIIFMGCSVANTLRNPLDYNTREDMLKIGILEKHLPKLILFPLQDQKSDTVWSKILDQKIKEIILPREKPVLLGGRDSFFPHYEGNYDYIDIGGDIKDNASEVREGIQLSQFSFCEVKAFAAGAIYHSKQLWYNPLPVVDMAVVKHDTNLGWLIALGRKTNETDWRLAGGFVDAGENYETAARREVEEELNCSDGDFSRVTMLGSKVIDDWRYPKKSGQNLVSTFFCFEMGDPRNQVVAGDDLVETKWFELSRINDTHIIKSHLEMINTHLNPYLEKT